MMEIKSTELSIAASDEQLLSLLRKPENLKEFLPAERIDKWSATDDGCSFQIKGLAHINLKLSEGEGKSVIYASASENPFPFQLKLNIKKLDVNESALQIEMNAEINAMMAMMISTPLKNFIQMLADAVKAKYAST